MSKARLLVFAITLLTFGGALTFLNRGGGQQKPSAAAAAPELAADDVLVAASDQPKGTLLASNAFRWQTWPKAAVGPEMIVKTADPGAVSQLTGGVVREGMIAGEPVTRAKIVVGTNAGFMSAMLPKGKRAIAINIDSNGGNSAGGFILPNDHVDVVLASTGTDPGQHIATVHGRTLLRNVKVLAIGQNVQEKNGQRVVVGSNATLELTPTQAETIVAAQRENGAYLALALRALVDDAKISKEETATPGRTAGVTIVRFGIPTVEGRQ
ncbi:MAG: Flp pilus assembly protein CpaB [Hyphomicrobiales bacterium]|nr:Flp pilus assembly protein CpaB [Hyphomicrobiales bacterium]MDE2017505.1 Flp pilus assembly protein CpaB [Hyphomicrobiales bacterium]